MRRTRKNPVENAGSAASHVEARKVSDNRMPLPGLANINTTGPPKRKAVPFAKVSPTEGNAPSAREMTQLETSITQGILSNAAVEQPANEFRRPSWPASANRAPNITSLARPVYPSVHPATNRPASKSTSLPVPGPKPRTPSPSLLQRMPSFEASRAPAALAPPATSRRLNMKKASVDDLRRLYEERAGFAKTLVETGKRK